MTTATGKGRGGKRSGAGRPKGAKAKHTEILEARRQRMNDGQPNVLPLDMMLSTMDELWRKAEIAKATGEPLIEMKPRGDGGKQKGLRIANVYTELELRMLAIDVAAKAAPYCHPRLAQVDSNVNATVKRYEESLLELANPDATGDDAQPGS